MNQMTVFEWMSEIDPALIARASAPVKAKRRSGIRAVMIIAAALALLMIAMTVSCAFMLDAYVEQRYEDYDGTILHALDFVLTQDDNAFSNLLLDENREALHMLFEALRGLGSERDEQETKPSEGLEFKPFRENKICLVSGIGTCTDTNIVIPQYDPNGYEVVGIQKYAFNCCTEIKRITIPEGVQYIEGLAFSGCTSLEEVYIPDSVTMLEEMLFANCSSLKSVRLPSGITSIRKQLFGFATGLESFTVPDGVTRIGAYAFDHCTSLESIEIPDSVQVIEHGAFRHCTSLTSFIIPEGVTRIQSEAFNHCDSMTSIVIPKSVTEIESEAFRVCEQLTDVYYTGTEEEWAAVTIGSYNNALKSVTVHYNYVPQE